MPLSPFNAEFPIEGFTTQGQDGQPAEIDYRARPIEELLAAGSDLSRQVFSLTNDIHPVFQDKHICACEYTDDLYCCAPYFAANPDEVADKEKAPAIASPYATKNVLVRTIMQLATNFLTHDDTLPFWAGIIDCARGPRQEVGRFHVHPKKRLSEDRKADTL
jgi:hypothetical protein